MARPRASSARLQQAITAMKDTEATSNMVTFKRKDGSVVSFKRRAKKKAGA